MLVTMIETVASMRAVGEIATRKMRMNTTERLLDLHSQAR
jgi:xanthine/uracil permease